MTGLSRSPLLCSCLTILLLVASPSFSQNAPSGDKGSAKPPTEQAGAESAPAPTPAPTPAHVIHIVPFGPPATRPKASSKVGGRSSNNGKVQYWGGPVISQVQPVVVMWGSFVDSGSTGIIQQFYTDITTSDYFDLLAEYSTAGLTGFGGTGGSNQTIDNEVFSAPKFTISPSVCPGNSAATACSIDDGQIQSELLAQINAGHLPQPIQDTQGNFNTIYMIYFPPGVSITEGNASSCVNQGFCAYHSNVGISSLDVPYGVFPDFSRGGCSPTFGGCGPGTAAETLTAVSSHELAEAVTDPDVGTAPSFAPPLGWVDGNPADANTTFGEEIGDLCLAEDALITVNGNTYSVQQLWSNMANNCVLTPGHFQITPATTSVPPGVPFQVKVTAQSSFDVGIFGYNDTVHLSSSDGTATIPADYTYVPSTDTNGSHTFTFTMNTIGSQTIGAADTLIKRMTGSGTIDVEHNPDLSVTMTHTDPFLQGDPADTYTITVTNVGDVQTTATQVTASVGPFGALPFGLSATGISGTGWSCTITNLTCTRSDTVGAHMSFPPITLTVSVATNTPTPVTTAVQVSGGGELNTSNDLATDVTNVTQFPDLTVFASTSGAFSQGQIGATYTIQVNNTGTIGTTAPVSVTDMLPASGLTPTSMSGTGWNCTLASLTCTRSDSLPAFKSYPIITLAVTVASTLPTGTVTSIVTVSGGGERVTSNDTDTLVTQVIPPTPDLVIASTHAGNFTQGQVGATYTVTVSNIGPAPTSGTVTAIDEVPSEYTTTSIAGTGWSCTLSTLTCTRSDALVGFTSGSAPPSYPPITVTMNISPSAGPSNTNLVVTSGGGEFNTGNDSMFDPTTVIQLPNLVVGQNVSGILAQGLTGINFALTVSNINAFASTIGTVTATEQLSSGLTATAINGSGWNCTLSTLTCTRSDSIGPKGSYPVITVTVNVASNSPSSVTTTATVSGGGEIITSDDSTVLITSVSPPMTLNTFNASQTIKAGAAAIFSITLAAPVPGAITLSCGSGVPPGTTCIVFPSSLTAPANATILVTLSTTAGGSVAFDSNMRGGRKSGEAATFLYTALMACLGFVLILPSRNRQAGKKRRWAMLVGLFALVTVLLTPGCGGGGGGGGTITATPAGTYNITVTANEPTANSQATIQLTLVVQ